MKQKNNCSYFVAIFIDSIVWTLGWIEGTIIGSAFCCCQCVNDYDDDNIVTEYIEGVTNGFYNAENLSHHSKSHH